MQSLKKEPSELQLKYQSDLDNINKANKKSIDDIKNENIVMMIEF